MRTILTVFLTLGFWTSADTASAQTSADGPVETKTHHGHLPNLRKEHEFDGIDIPKYADFWELWHLITVRYRKDNGEQRFVYANDIAFKAITAGAKKYPDGAMFGKVAFKVMEDKAFPNSLEPNGLTRIQLMKKDKLKYPESNGWGYALFTAGKGVDYANAKTTVQSCHACHQIVADRDYVFSHTAFEAGWQPEAKSSFSQKFADKVFDSLDQKLQRALETTGAELTMDTHIKVLEMALFTGSVNESTGPIIEYARKDQSPYLLADEQNNYFIAAVPTPVSSSGCENEVKLAKIRSVFTKGHPERTRRMIERGRACGDAVTWEGSRPQGLHR